MKDVFLYSDDHYFCIGFKRAMFLKGINCVLIDRCKPDLFYSLSIDDVVIVYFDGLVKNSLPCLKCLSQKSKLIILTSSNTVNIDSILPYGVIMSTKCTVNELFKAINYLMNRTFYKRTGELSLNNNECSVLIKLMDGKSIKNIAQEIGCDLKRAYSIKYRACSKLGIKSNYSYHLMLKVMFGCSNCIPDIHDSLNFDEKRN